jgi:molecular chaperone Hsp33
LSSFAEIDRVYRFYSTDLTFRAAVVITTRASRIICGQLQSSPSATVGLSRALSGAALLAAHMSENQQIGLHFNGDGPIAGIFAEATYEGELRAWCGNPQVDAIRQQQDKNARLDVADAIGKGILTVVRSVPFEKQPRVSTVPLVTSQVGQDIAWYLEQSAQIPSLISLGVLLAEDGTVQCSGGVLIELMPQANDAPASPGTKSPNEALINRLEELAAKAPPLSGQIEGATKPEDLLRIYTGEIQLVASELVHDLYFRCRCSQSRLERSLALLGGHEIDELVKARKDIEAKCQFCGASYVVKLERIEDLLAEIKTAGTNQKN